MKIRLAITEPLAAHLTHLAQTEGLSLKEFSERTILTGLLKLEVPNQVIKEKAKESAAPILAALDAKKMAFLDEKNMREAEARKKAEIAAQEARNQESGVRIKNMVASMELSELRTLLAAISEKVGVA